VAKTAKSLISKADQSAKEARKWKGEIDLAGKREKSWLKDAEKVLERYRGEEAKKNRFNVLWSNTEILRPAIYNSRPAPDVRRRFRDADPLGKAVSEVLERSLMVMVDYECTDQILKNDAFDGLVVGRGVSRIRYIPSLSQVGEDDKLPGEQAEPSGANDSQTADSDDHSGTEQEEQEEVDYEQVLPEHVDFRDFRHGYGRVWDEVPWCSFRHKLTKPDALKKFDDADISRVKFAAPTSEDPKKPGEEVNETSKVAEFWEVWDKIGAQVFFTQDDVEQLLFPKDNPDGSPPIDFSGFFPIPEPLRLIENSGSLLPIIPFHLYEEQANQLDKISGRIDRIIDRMRLRGIYDSTLTELPDLLSNDDNELTPVQSAKAWMDVGGLDKAISWFPIEKAQAILVSLYDARDKQKAIIDELTGIADIMRGATDPNETASAQNLKATFGSIRLQRMQKEVQRYAKDLMRLASEAMCGKFAPQTFAEMTELQFPTAQQKAQMQMQAQQAQAMAGQPPQPGMPPPPPPPDLALLKVPSWDEILQLMRSASMRRFKIDVETDSTVAGTLNSDMAGLSQVLSAIGEVMPKLAELVQSGALPLDAAKELIMTIIRRARMGMAVEDAFDKMQAPKPPPDPNAAKAQADVQKSQADAAAKVQVAQASAQAQVQKSEAESRIEMQVQQFKEQAETQRQVTAQAHEASLAAMQEKFEAATKIIVAMIGATKSADPEAGPIAEREFAREVQ
jgi:hypothetical protein